MKNSKLPTCHRPSALRRSMQGVQPVLSVVGTDFARPKSVARGRGFTLLEMLVAVGAVTIIALGVSQIFRATGTTIRTGKRLNNLNAAASMMQRQLAADFAAMTRDGFLLIKNEEARGPGNNGIKLFNDTYSRVKAPAARKRRVDQIQFFATGDFTSLRAPEHPARVPRSTVARVWYGHGLKGDPTDPDFDAPLKIDSANATFGPGSAQSSPGFGQPLAGGVPGPNQFASEWTLLRHTTLLVQPDLADRQDPPPGASPPGTGRNPIPGGSLAALEWPDNDIQISLQPAVSSIFASLAELLPDTLPADGDLVRDGANDTTRPRIGSGLVDIAATDLGQIRRWILTSDPVGPPPATLPLPASAGLPTMTFDPDPDAGGGSTEVQQAWMRDALPVNGDGSYTNLTGPTPATGGRIRYEREPINFLCEGAGWPTGNAKREYRKTDQMMLSASNFIPNCTEFIVEWSFGKTYPLTGAGIPQGQEGQVIWHGLDRFDDANANGTYENGERLYAEPYEDAGLGGAFVLVPQRNGNQFVWPIKQGLIHDVALLAQGLPQRQRLYSYFGYLDPSFRPDFHFPPTDDPANPDGNLYNDPDDFVPDALPWAWPTMIRVTVTLVDPTEPSVEQTYQFVFKVPAAPATN